MKSWILILIFISKASFAITGEVGNGGDICERRFLEVRDDVKSWLTKNGSSRLVLPEGLSLEFYNSKMVEFIEIAKISCTTNPVFVGKLEKTCINQIDPSGTHTITCNGSRFMSTSQSDQYVLVHHEYAGLAGFESNESEQSRYFISNQLTGFLEDQITKRLVVNPSEGSGKVCERTPLVREAIEKALGRPCEQISFEALSYIGGEMKIRSYDPVTLKPFDFHGLTYLKSLTATFAKGRNAPSELFRDLKSLNRLDFSVAPDVEVPVNIFDNLEALQVLDFTFKNIQARHLQKLTHLKYIFLTSHLAGATLPANIFENHHDYEQIYFSGIGHFPPGIFNGMQTVTSIKLGNISRQTLTSDFFKNFPALKSVSIELSSVVEVPDYLFKGLENLKSVQFTGNKITKISDQVFSLDGINSSATVRFWVNPIDEQTKTILQQQLGSRVRF